MYMAKLWEQCSNYLSLFNWELFCEKLAIKWEINIHLSSRQREWLKPATKSKKYFMTSSNRTKIRELYSVCKNSSLLGIQRDRQKDNHNLQKTFLHLTTDNFSLKSGVCKLTTLKFPLLLFVAYFFSIWATYFCEVYKLFSYPLTIRCWLFGKILRAFLIFVTDFFAKSQPENIKKIPL